MIERLKKAKVEDNELTVNRLCRIMGVSRSGFYKHVPLEIDEGIKASSVLKYCIYIRESLPKVGVEPLLRMCNEFFKEKFTIGRDWLYRLLGANDMLIRKKKSYCPPRTTNGVVNHGFDDHVNTLPKFIPTDHCQLVVSDITYIRIKDKFVYLSLTMDAYSRIITGYSLQEDLSTNGPMEALKQTVAFYKKHLYQVNGLIFHSDRGTQYVSHQMTDYEASLGIITSVTQTGDPLHNAMAERLNGTIKNDLFFSYEAFDFEEAKKAIAKAVDLYNNARPHRAIGMKTPMQMLDHNHINPLTQRSSKRKLL